MPLPPKTLASSDPQNRFRQLHRLSLAPHQSYTATYADYLETGLQLFGMTTGIISHISGETYTILAVRSSDVEMASGDTFDLGDTYCARVVAQAKSVVVPRAAEDDEFCGHPIYKNTGLESYLAAPIWVDGEIYGTLGFTSKEPRDNFCEEDTELLELMALGLGQLIERDRHQRNRTEAAAALRENMQLFESAFEKAAIGMALVAPDGRWLRVNQALAEIVGYSQSELLAIDFQRITHPDDLDADMTYVRQILEGTRDTYRMEKRYIHKNSHVVWALLSVSLVREPSGEPRYFISQIQDISEEKHALSELRQKQHQLQLANQELERLATRDPLTQLYNRRAYMERFDKELLASVRTGLPVSLLLLDIDHFKSFNDDFGHQAGDLVLQETAKMLLSASRAQDIVSRHGGEEFTVILPNTDREGSRVVAERIRKAIDSIQSLDRPITVSIGCATSDPIRGDQDPVDSRLMIKCADEALYNAKAMGRNCVMLSPNIVTTRSS